MLLTVDVGNTRTVFGLVRDRGIVASFDCATRVDRTADEVAIFITCALAARGHSKEDVTDAILASVVPRSSGAVVKALTTAFSCEPMEIGPGVKTGISIRYDSPRDVGVDRIANAVGARRAAGPVPLIIIDFGTATTFDVVDEGANYLGGIILPGVAVASDAIVSRTALLHRFKIERPPSVVGKNTVHALQSGVYFGTVAQIDGLVAMVKNEPGFQSATVVATGGYASLFTEGCSSIDRVEPNLTLEGLIEIFEQNRR